ncbi:hypothetical protein INR49_024533 [Caranx melampygus]|nr:hypothetical protein INR49_024533 [Caranx melampygus]
MYPSSSREDSVVQRPWAEGAGAQLPTGLHRPGQDSEGVSVFDKLTYWNLETPPNSDDTVVMAMDWQRLAEAVGGSEGCWAEDGGMRETAKEEVSWEEGAAPEEDEEGERAKE